MENLAENQGNPTQHSFNRAKEALVKVREAYQEAKTSGGSISSVDLYEFPQMMEVVREAETENLKGVLRGEELKRIEDTKEFVALAQSIAGAKAIKRSHINETRLAVLEELGREGNNVAELMRVILKDIKDDPETIAKLAAERASADSRSKKPAAGKKGK
ncbi:MAG: hypothetical protein Q7S52_02020 [bacterium]|nr:hypothetical protein [bacterium]